MLRQFLDPVPIGMVFVLFAIITLACFEAGFRVGRWWQDRMPGEQEGPTEMLVGALMTLMAFLLAVTMGMAADRFDVRRANVLAEANAIGTAYLQADYLAEPATQELKELLREYLPLRNADDPAQVLEDLPSAMALNGEMWAIVAEAARSGYSPDLVSALGDSVAELVALNETRVVVGVQARVPEAILFVLIAGSALSLGMVGYMGGLKRRRSALSALVMVVTLGIVLTIVINLDRPQEGFLQVSQQPLLDVQQWIGLPSSQPFGRR